MQGPDPESGYCHFYPRPPRGGRPYPLHQFQYPKLHFYPRPPRGGRLVHEIATNLSLKFLSTPSARRATPAAAATDGFAEISIHALREEGDSCPHSRLQRLGISIHALREEGDGIPFRNCRVRDISIHALREEGDHHHRGCPCGVVISIHALREEGDHIDDVIEMFRTLFLSTPSARRATLQASR